MGKQTFDDSEDPCSEERKLSVACLNNNAKSSCDKYVENYRLCRTFWRKITIERARKNINPIVPPPEERAEMKAKYFEKMHKDLDRFEEEKRIGLEKIRRKYRLSD